MKSSTSINFRGFFKIYFSGCHINHTLEIWRNNASEFNTSNCIHSDKAVLNSPDLLWQPQFEVFTHNVLTILRKQLQEHCFAARMNGVQTALKWCLDCLSLSGAKRQIQCITHRYLKSINSIQWSSVYILWTSASFTPNRTKLDWCRRRKVTLWSSQHFLLELRCPFGR